MDVTTIDPIWWIVVGVLVVLLVGLLVWSIRRRASHTEQLKGRFKSEYDRTASSASKKKTEEDLDRRTERRSRVDLVDLNESDAANLQQHLDELLRSFADGPQGAALGMSQLVGRVAAARGYIATEGSVLDLVSVDHPEQVAAMRRSEAEMHKAKGSDLTEASRQTFLDARVLVERLLAEGRAGHLDEDVAEPPPPVSGQPQSDITPDADAPPVSGQPQSDIAADAPPPPLPQDEPPASEPDRGTEAGWTSEPRAPEGPQEGSTGGGTPPRR